jgi:hypothetical protein
VSGVSRYHGEWQSCDGFYAGEISSTETDGMWPAMVAFQLAFGEEAGVAGMITSEDARALAAQLENAASRANAVNYIARVNRMSVRPTPPAEISPEGRA